MKLISYAAGKGDAFLLEWGEENNKHYLLVDSGIPNTYRFIRDDLKVIKKLDAVILTHVDYDHLGGFFKLLADGDRPIALDYDIFMNTPALALVPSENDRVKLEHGIKLEKKLKDLDITCKSMYLGSAENDQVTIEGLKLKVLSPSKTVLDKLIADWTADDLYKVYQEEDTSSDKAGKATNIMPSYDEIIGGLESVRKWDADLINSSSVAFIACYREQSILFLGDANPDLVAEALRASGYTIDNKLKVNLVKVSHHGCKHNSSKALYELIDCQCFLISTDGTGKYYHPDRETIVRLAEYTRVDKEQPMNIYLNYDLDTSNFILDTEAREWNVRIDHKNVLDLNDTKACSQNK